MWIDTSSGLHGELIAYIQTATKRRSGPTPGGGATFESVVIVRREGMADDSAYSTHVLYERVEASGVSFSAEAGHYDMTLEQARVDLLKRAKWGI